MRSPKVSIIIPNYNNAKYLEASVRSVQKQTYDDIEIILVDDQSTDGSYEIARKIAAKDPRVKLFRMPENSGAGAARNKGLDLATGKFVMFLDSDDLMAPTAVKGMVTIQSGTGCDMISGGFTRVPDNFYIPKDAKFPAPQFVFDIYDKNYDFVNRIGALSICVVWSKLIRREILDGLRFRTDIWPCEDVEFIMRLYARIENGGAVMHATTVFYRQSATSIILQENRDITDALVKTLESLAAFVKDKKNGHKHYLEFLRHYTYTFLRVWATTIYGKMIKPATGPRRREYRRDFRNQLLRLAKTARELLRRGNFKGVKISTWEKLALLLFSFGFVETATLMFMVKYS